MRLYLSSFDIGNYPEELQKLVGNGNKAVLVLNALDCMPEKINKWRNKETETLQKLGFIVEELDLREYFGKQNELDQYLSTKDLVWVNGGNSFLLRRAMKQSGFDIVIKDMLSQDSIVYGGFSAGIVVLTKDMHGIEITDEPNQITDGYNPEIIWEGLELLDYAVAVHYKSNHPESALTDQEVQYYKENNIPYRTLSDGQVIVINGSETKFLS